MVAKTKIKIMEKIKIPVAGIILGGVLVAGIIPVVVAGIIPAVGVDPGVASLVMPSSRLLDREQRLGIGGGMGLSSLGLSSLPIPYPRLDEAHMAAQTAGSAEYWARCSWIRATAAGFFG